MKRPNRKDYINTKTKNELIADLERYINYLEKQSGSIKLKLSKPQKLKLQSVQDENGF